MCRNIRTLFNFAPPATEDEIRAASLQFVRKISGFSKPSRANEVAFQTCGRRDRPHLGSTSARARIPRGTEESGGEMAKAKARSAQRFAT